MTMSEKWHLIEGIDYTQVNSSVNLNGVAIIDVILSLDSAKSIAVMESDRITLW